MGYPRVIVIGSGFGGLNVTKKLKRAKVKLLLIDKSNHHLFQPLLYQVATAALAPRDIAIPIREVFKNQSNTTVLMNDVTEVHPDKNTIKLVSGETLPFDYLVLAIGSHHSYFGKSQWEQLAPGLKTLKDAIRIRDEILLAYENAENSDSHSDVEEYLTFVIVGGGPTGVEMAGAIAEIAHKTLMKNFRKIDPTKTRIYIVEGHPHLLPPYPEELGRRAAKDLEKLGVQVITGCHVTNMTEHGVYIGERFIGSRNIIWAAGNQVQELTTQLGVPVDHQNRVIVNPDLSIPGHPNIFAIGDCAHARDEKENPLPGIAPVAIQQGHYVAKIIKSKVAPEHRKPFKYFDKGSLATIGKAKAVGMVGKYKLKGLFAWLTWCFIHIFYLVGFRNRLIVMMEWFFWYITGSRSSRLIYDTFEHERNLRGDEHTEQLAKNSKENTPKQPEQHSQERKKETAKT
ncbi:MAG: NAD(P)/FAD-dependent oxidoreductase [Chlamydiales bacterium]